MKLYKIFILALLAVLAVSCEDELEIQPAQSIAGEQAIATESNIANILIGAYDEAGQGASYGGRLQIMADLLGSGEVTRWGGTFLDPRQVKTKTMLTDNGFVGGYWNNAFEVINQANLVINNADIVTSSMDEKNRIEGEAKFLRALSYFDLVRHFGGVPIRTEGISDYSVDLSIARNSEAEVYALVISDLQDAIALLPASNSFFVDNAGAEALLARVYLQQGNFAGARDAANNVIMTSGHGLAGTYAGAFNNDSDSPEDVFAFQVTSQTGSNNLITHYASQANGGRAGDITVEQPFIDLFDDPADVRANFTYISPDNGGTLTSKYTNQFGNVPLIRLAEMFLIRAEGNFEEGTMVGDSPLNDLNQLRTRAVSTPIAGPVTKSIILNERILELAFEGFAIHDVIRTQGSVDGFAFDAPELRFPIPQSEMDTNPLMTQNPGYN